MRRVTLIPLFVLALAGCADGVLFDVSIDPVVRDSAGRVAIAIRAFNDPSDTSPVEVRCVNSNEEIPMTIFVSPGVEYYENLAVRVEGWQRARVWAYEETFPFLAEGGVTEWGVAVPRGCSQCQPNEFCNWEGNCLPQSEDRAFGLDVTDYRPSCMTN